jgi:serine/threonine protein kinase
VNRGMRVIRPLATGSFGSVFLVSSPYDDDRAVAVKVLPIDATRTSDPEYDCLRALRLQGEIPGAVSAIGAVLVHTLPREFAVFMSAGAPGQAYLLIVMEFIPGCTLRQFLISHATLHLPLWRKEIAAWTTRLALFCHFAYKRIGLTHNDIKLGNVMIESSSRLRVIDYTFAERADVIDEGFDTWQRGTRCYMPPEKLFFKTRPVGLVSSASSDVWAVGTIMSTLALSGQVIINRGPGSRIDEVLDATRFTPALTDTVYQLLSSSTPWFARIVKTMVQESGLDRDWIEQGVRLLLWTRALVYGNNHVMRSSGDFALPGNEYMPGIEQTPLHKVRSLTQKKKTVRSQKKKKVLDKYTTTIMQFYDADMFPVFEQAYSQLRDALGDEMTHAYVATQTWNPLNRGSFALLIQRLENSASTRLDTVHQRIPCEGRSSFSPFASLDEFLEARSKNRCKQCDGYAPPTQTTTTAATQAMTTTAATATPKTTIDGFCSAQCKTWTQIN